MFTGPQHTLALRGNLCLPQAMPTDGELQYTPPDVLKIPPISEQDHVAQIISKVGSTDQLLNAVNQLQTLPHAA